MKWIKASDRLPVELGKVHWRDADSKLPITAGIAYRFSISENESDLVEWLDESEPTPEVGTERSWINLVHSLLGEMETFQPDEFKNIHPGMKQFYDWAGKYLKEPTPELGKTESMPEFDEGIKNMSQLSKEKVDNSIIDFLTKECEAKDKEIRELKEYIVNLKNNIASFSI